MEPSSATAIYSEEYGVNNQGLKPTDFLGMSIMFAVTFMAFVVPGLAKWILLGFVIVGVRALLQERGVL